MSDQAGAALPVAAQRSPDSYVANARFLFRKNRNTIFTALLTIIVFVTVVTLNSGSFSYFDFSTMIGTGGTLALAAIGQTLVVLTGGFDLSAGAVVSLANVVVGTTMTDSLWSQILAGVLGLAAGAAAGAFNGFFIAYLRIQPIVVTLATLFIVQGVALLVSPTPGGYVAPGFASLFTGAAIPGVVPAALVVILLAVAIWVVIRNSRLGVAIYAIGSDEDAAAAAGIRTRTTKFITYVLAGTFYGAAGIFIGAQSGGADPLVGAPMLLQIFAAVVLGGTRLGGGRGSVIGTVIGAYLLMMFVNVLLIFALPTYLAPIADGAVLLIAIIVGALGSPGSFLRNLAEIGREVAGARLAWARRSERQPLGPLRLLTTPLPDRGRWVDRNWETIKPTLPAYFAFLAVLVVTYFYLGGFGGSYLKSLLLLSAFLSILAFGQSTVILAGGLDLSIPSAVTLCACVFAALVAGSNHALLYAVPGVLICGALIGAANGVGITVLGLPPIVMTLAANGILQGLALALTGGSPTGFAPPGLRWFVTGAFAGATPAVWLFPLFVIAGVVLQRSTFIGRKIYAIGNSTKVATLSGVDVRATVITAYTISGLCAALVSILLVGFNGAANLGMGDEYLLPSIAVVVAGGVLITGGRGHYLGVIGGVLLLIALQILISGTLLPDSVRGIIFGFVMLAALMALQQRRTG
jgi:ribose transport system permease protein